MGKIKVLIVDDSAVVRKLLTEALSRSRDIEVVGVALDPFIAVSKIGKLKPDILTLDIEMPRMDGLTFLSKLMKSQPMPVIMVSTLTEKGANATIKALEYGAIDFILKPSLEDESEFKIFSDDLIEKIITAGGSKVKKKVIQRESAKTGGIEIAEKHTADVILSKAPSKRMKRRTDTIIAIGASTGGTEVITEILSNLSEDVPGVVVVQHMPEKFTKSFAERVDGLSRVFVKEAENGDRVYQGEALIAPGNRHMILKSDRDGYFVEINDGPPVNRHRPAVDVLFRSVSQIASHNSLGIICTGMGADGAQGLLEVRDAGINTIAQDEESCVVFGMPAEAIKLGAANMVMNIQGIIEHITVLGNTHRT